MIFYWIKRFKLQFLGQIIDKNIVVSCLMYTYTMIPQTGHLVNDIPSLAMHLQLK